MPRYQLRDPNDASDTLVQHGQSWDEPIYKATSANRFYILKWGRDCTRQLHPFDPATGAITGAPFDVAQDWTGEPRVIGIDEDLWGDLPTLAQSDVNAERLLEQLARDLIEGDVIRLTRDGATTGRLRARRSGGQWTLVRA